MIVLALILLLIAAAAVVFIVALGLHQQVAFSFFAGDFVTNPLTIFIAGAATLLLFVLALGLINGGTKRSVARRREVKRLRKVEETSVPADEAGARTARHGRDHDLDRGEDDRGVSHDVGNRDREVDLRHGEGSDETLARPARTNGTNDTNGTDETRRI